MTHPTPEPAYFLAFSGLQRMRVYARARIMIGKAEIILPILPILHLNQCFARPLVALLAKNAQCLMLNDIPVGVG